MNAGGVIVQQKRSYRLLWFFSPVLGLLLLLYFSFPYYLPKLFSYFSGGWQLEQSSVGFAASADEVSADISELRISHHKHGVFSLKDGEVRYDWRERRLTLGAASVRYDMLDASAAPSAPGALMLSEVLPLSWLDTVNALPQVFADLKHFEFHYGEQSLVLSQWALRSEPNQKQLTARLSASEYSRLLTSFDLSELGAVLGLPEGGVDGYLQISARIDGEGQVYFDVKSIADKKEALPKELSVFELSTSITQVGEVIIASVNWVSEFPVERGQTLFDYMGLSPISEIASNKHLGVQNRMKANLEIKLPDQPLGGFKDLLQTQIKGDISVVLTSPSQYLPLHAEANFALNATAHQQKISMILAVPDDARASGLAPSEHVLFFSEFTVDGQEHRVQARLDEPFSGAVTLSASDSSTEVLSFEALSFGKASLLIDVKFIDANRINNKTEDSEGGLAVAAHVHLGAWQWLPQKSVAIDWAISLAPLVVTSDLTVPPLRAQGQLTLNADFSLSASSLVLNNACDDLLFEGEWLAGSGSDAGVGELHLKSTRFFSEKASLRRWLNFPDLPIEAVFGRLDASLDWFGSGSPAIALEMKEGTFLGDFGMLEGVQFRLSSQALSLLEEPLREESLPEESLLSGRELNSVQAFQAYDFDGAVSRAELGVDLTNISFAGSLSLHEELLNLELSNMRAAVFGGELVVQPKSWVLDATSDIEINVEVTNFDLKELVASQGLTELNVLGEVSGILPIRISQGEFFIEDGLLADNDGGLIQYKSPLLQSPDLGSSMKLTLEVLENFDYQVLSTRASYNEGDLVLQSRIQGRNPNAAAGRAIDLNLNTTIELASSIKALRVISGIEQMVESYFDPNELVSMHRYCEQSN